MKRTRLQAPLLHWLLAGALLTPAAPVAAAAAPAAPATAPAVVAAERHWAVASVAELTRAFGWAAPADLDAAIPVTEWNRLVALLAGEQPADADPQVNPRQHWVWTYSGGMARGTMVVRREDAIGGLMKLTSVLYKEPSFSADPGALSTFHDGAQVSEWQQALVAGAVRLGLVNGWPGGSLQPQRPLTYAEGATLVARLLSRYPQEGAVVKPAPQTEWPQPRGFAAGLGLKLPADQVIHAGWPVGSAGPAFWVINGAAWAPDLAGVGAAPQGHVWVVVDTEIYNWNAPGELSLAPEALRFTLDIASDSVPPFHVDQAASAALGSPFGQDTVVLKAGESLRGLLVYAVPAGTKGLWMQGDSKLGLASGKPGWNSTTRMQLGDLPTR